MNSINSTYRFIALFLALLIFTTSVGFAVDIHYCQGELKTVSFFGKAKSCHNMANATPMKNCPQHQKMLKQSENCSVDTQDCCGNKTLHFQSDQDKVLQTVDFTLNKQLQQFVATYVVVFFSINSFKKVSTPFIFYKVPLIIRDIPVFFQSFLL